MQLTDLDMILLLILRVGDIDPDSGDPVSPLKPNSSGIILQNSERLFAKYNQYIGVHPTLGPRLFDAFFMRAATELVISVLESRVDFSAIGTAMRVSLNQRRARAERFLETLNDRIERLEMQIQMWAPPLVGQLAATTPITPPNPGGISSPRAPNRVDADDPRFSGSPYWRPTWRRL